MFYARMRWLTGCIVGVLTHVLFAVTVWYLFWFLDGRDSAATTGSMWLNCLLAFQFALSHSLILFPATRRWLSRWIAPAFYGCFFCVVTCVSLLITFAYWQTSAIVFWQLEGGSRLLIKDAFFASWVALIYALSLTGLGYQTGLTPWLAWLRARKLPRREFVPHGAYRWIRHPVYLAFLGLIWFTPTMTLDRMVLAGVWSAYILAGSYLKDARLVYYLGDTYRAYQAKVPGYPFVVFGPLARIPQQASTESVSTQSSAIPVSHDHLAA